MAFMCKYKKSVRPHLVSFNTCIVSNLNWLLWAKCLLNSELKIVIIWSQGKISLVNELFIIGLTSEISNSSTGYLSNWFRVFMTWSQRNHTRESKKWLYAQLKDFILTNFLNKHHVISSKIQINIKCLNEDARIYYINK